MGNRKRIRAALARLLEGEFGFLIIEEEATEKFVQFTGGREIGLWFDLPIQPLSPEEAEKAKLILAVHGMALEERQVRDPPDGFPETECSFQKDFGADVAGATALAWCVLRKIYGFTPKFAMRIQES